MSFRHLLDIFSLCQKDKLKKTSFHYPHTYLFYMAKVVVLILFFLNKIINDPPSYLTYRSFFDKCIMSQYDLRFCFIVDRK